jgi:aminopeptidase N
MDLKLFILFLALVKFTISNPFDPPLKLGKFQSKDIDFEDTYRLPNNSLPLSYDLWLETHVGAEDEDYEFQGKVKIAIEITNSTDVITLHYRKINITKVDQLDFADSTTKVKENLELSYDIVKEFLRIKLDKIHTGGEKIVLDIIYNGELRYDDSGFYRSKYQDVNNKTIWYATTQFEMTDARHCMPCYDEPGIRAPISLKIHHSSKYNAISNTPILSRVASGKTGYDLTTFETTPKMQTYLLAFLISDFDYKSNNNTRVEQRVYATPQAIKDGEADFAVGVVDSILKGLESHLGIDYPLKKMDHAAITDFRFGAMENFVREKS